MGNKRCIAKFALLAVASFQLVLSLPANGMGYSGIIGSKHDLSAGTNADPCAFCHTPDGNGNSPAWIKASENPGAVRTYAGKTMGTVYADTPNSISLLCLSCHDDTHGSGVAPNFGDGAPRGRGDYVIDPNKNHPVSMPYPSLSRAGYFVPPDPGSGWQEVKLFNGSVECASCHDPHNPANGNFLRKANKGSALCYTCHDK